MNNSPEDDIPLPSEGVLSEEESIRQLRRDFDRQYISEISMLKSELERLKLATFSQFARIEELKTQVKELINQRNQLLPLQSEMTKLKETHIMQLAAISVAANINKRR